MQNFVQGKMYAEGAIWFYSYVSWAKDPIMTSIDEAAAIWWIH